MNSGCKTIEILVRFKTSAYYKIIGYPGIQTRDVYWLDEPIIQLQSDNKASPKLKTMGIGIFLNCCSVASALLVE